MSVVSFRWFTVHASATRPSIDVDVNLIDGWHRERGWNGVGYHYVIKRDGTVQTGRQLERTGAHVGGHNTGNLGICMAGGVKQSDGVTPEDNFTDAQYESLTKILTGLHSQWSDAEVIGHNEFPNYKSRGCPCFDIASYRKYLYNAWAQTDVSPLNWWNQSKWHWKDNIDKNWAGEE